MAWSLEAATERLSGQAPLLRSRLLAWWRLEGRHDLPWKLHADGRPPQPGETLDPWGIWVAEVNPPHAR
ncbi:hypothetical protein IQ216_03420 [Cyanobium sp. LEGE 06143]|uniref:hypothetical protein n=1 Tax=Cyanobium sp. LEGE 06143 TaxID=945727 RepID=UPI00187F73CF|nr:hypothetical protein [Cyanobium sp. LEGE 06143]MBE9172162.1 hypothetical protein [Cyanobium sp. LEGE 06143]